ncbi:hypothetical protein FZW96_12835 [Bacillus sp. BGMRC 2118]|nr:hypothetical protein FZW96_12835 [Bacillus sp. BGMRC 2118]
MKRLLLAVIILAIPLILINAHTAYVAELNKFDDTSMKDLEKRLNEIDGLTKHFEGKLELKYAKKSNSVYETHIYELVGTAKPEFFELDPIVEWETKVEMAKFISKEYNPASKIQCGRNKMCALEDFVIVHPKSKVQFRQPFWKYN